MNLLINIYYYYIFLGMIALRREATIVTHEDFMDAILEVQAKKKQNLNYYAWFGKSVNTYYYYYDKFV